MTLDQLRQFQAAGKYESFTVAAEHLYSHTSTVSRSVSMLEKELGIELFGRTNRGIHLTEAGRYFMGEVELLLEALNQAVGQTRNIGKRTTEKLVIRLGENMYTCVSHLFRAFLSEHSSAWLDLDTYPYGDSLDVCRKLDDRTIDLYFGYEDNIPSSSVAAWSLRKVYSDRIAIIVGRGHRLAERESLCLSDLQNELLIGSDFHDFQLEHRALAAMKERGYKPLKPIHGLAYNDMFMRVSAGLGVSFIASSTTSATAWDCKIIPLTDFHYEKPLYMIWRRDNRNPTLEQFLEVVAGRLAEQSKP